jgi:hypothetical protein
LRAPIGGPRDLGPTDLICRVIAQDTEHVHDIVNQLTAAAAQPSRGASG